MHYKRHYIQYNDLVFGEAAVIDEDDASASFKTFDAEYGFTHGSYAPQKRKGVLVKAGRVSLTITLKMKKIPCEDRPYYVRFAKKQLLEQGRLWAVQDNRLVWAWAYVSSYTEAVSSKANELEIDVNFELPEGIWHKADKLKTYVVPFNPCDFMDCYEWKDVNPCEHGATTDCCDCGKHEPVDLCECCDECDTVEKDNALCYFGDIQEFYDCERTRRVVYSCAAADKFFGDEHSAVSKGQKFCTIDGHLIAGKFYSETDIPTENIRITLHGKQMHNPYIEINGNGNIIVGDYEGYLVINPDGTVYNHIDDCPACEPLPVSVWNIPLGMKYGWTIEQGNNKLIIDAGTCCAVCAYIEEDALTI